MGREKRQIFQVSGRWSVVQTAGRWSLGAQSKIGDEAGFAGEGWKGPSLGGDGAADTDIDQAREKRTNDTSHAPKVDGIQSMKWKGKQASGSSSQPSVCPPSLVVTMGRQSRDDGFRLRPVWGNLAAEIALTWASPTIQTPRQCRRGSREGAMEGRRLRGILPPVTGLGRALESAQPLWHNVCMIAFEGELRLSRPALQKRLFFG